MENKMDVDKQKVSDITYLKFRSVEGGDVFEYVVVIYKALSEDELNQIEDAVSSYIEDNDEWQVDNLIHEVMNSFDFNWEKLKISKIIKL